MYPFRVLENVPNLTPETRSNAKTVMLSAADRSGSTTAVRGRPADTSAGLRHTIGLTPMASVCMGMPTQIDNLLVTHREQRPITYGKIVVKKAPGRPPAHWSDFFVKALNEQYGVPRVPRPRKHSGTREHTHTLEQSDDQRY
ncbi:unnamed protein product [Heligmosomoides polygyrus]|uniref:Transposase n=1 Tax=Heligmosomoides polygyrus TaxID=6339 RepID=A0A183FIF5_HELPZ|nr:unnamed protein product [Heligmosomoides polygyrus]